MSPFQYQFKNLNHLGLVAAMCRELKIAEYIEPRTTNDADARNVTIGQAVVAMIINNLLSCFRVALNNRYLVTDAAMYIAETLNSLD